MMNPTRTPNVIIRPKSVAPTDTTTCFVPGCDAVSAPPPSRHLPVLSLVAPFITLLSILALFSGCSSRTLPEPDPIAPFRAALRPEFHSYLDETSHLPKYEIDVTLAPDGDLLEGSASIDIPNTSADPWDKIIFRLYPTLEQYGGKMTIRSAAVNGQPSNFVYETENTSIRIDLLDPLLPQERVHVELTWKLDIPTWSDAPSVYALFGNSQEMTSLPLFYPSLAVYEAGPISGVGTWWQEMGSVRGDAAFNISSLFIVTTTLPANQVPIASGTLISSTLISNDTARHVWVTGPSREFLLHTSPTFRSTFTETLGTRVTSYWLPEHEAEGRVALAYAVAALRIYNDIYGPYPYRDLRIGPAPLAFRGMEYPQVSLLGVELYGRARRNMEILVAHELAHQWWYQMVHNDPVDTPWLDEAIAEYSVKLYLEALKGKREAETLQWQRWEIPVDRLDNIPVDKPVDDFEDGNQYETIVYGKGALFYDAMREALGDRRFSQFIQAYLEAHRFGIVDMDDWLGAIDDLNNPILLDLYDEYVRPAQTEPATDGGRTRPRMTP